LYYSRERVSLVREERVLRVATLCERDLLAREGRYIRSPLTGGGLPNVRRVT
jgi:hypothetical protein